MRTVYRLLDKYPNKCSAFLGEEKKIYLSLVAEGQICGKGTCSVFHMDQIQEETYREISYIFSRNTLCCHYKLILWSDTAAAPVLHDC